MEVPAEGSTKQDWRRWARSARAGADPRSLSNDVVAALAKWPPVVAARRILLFFPLPDEIDLTGLLTVGLSASFAATRTPADGMGLSVHTLNGPMETHRLGYEQPAREAPRVDPADLDVLLLPGLAFDLWGTRLGRGAGYFDRFLMQIDATVPVVGVTPAALVVDRLPREPHDLPVGHLATEEGVIGVAGSAPGRMP